MRPRTLLQPAVLRPGALAGLAGAVSIGVYLIGMGLLTAHEQGSVAGFFASVAATAVGPAAYAGSGGALLGAAIHLAIGVAWGIGYAVVAQQTPQVRSQPLMSGAVFGLVVMFAMQLVEVAANVYRLPDTFALANALVAHVVFFGIPVACIVTRQLDAAA